MAQTLSDPTDQVSAASLPASDTAPPDTMRRTLAAAALLLLITFLAYSPVLQNGFIWDDDDYVVENQTLRSAEGLLQIWFQPGATPQYYPLVHTSFWLEYRLWEVAPMGYHIVNVVLHAGAAILLWLLLGRLKVPGAWLGAAVFALHPVQVESVAWITERKNVLSALFYFAAALAYLRFALASDKPRFHPGLYAAALLLFLAALLSKTVTCTLPAALLVVLWWKRGRITWRDVLPLLPFFALGIGFGLLTAGMEKDRVGATGKEWDFTFIERCLIAGRALWFYATKLLVPYNLTFIYPRWTIDQSIAWLYIFPTTALALMGALYALRRRIGRAPLAAVLLFAGTLFPALGFFNVYPMRYSFVADHFQYHASASLLALFAAGLTLGARRFPFLLPRELRIVGGALLLLVCGILTWHQTHIYKSYASVWEDTLAKNPTSPIALTSVASVRVGAGKPEEAMALYRRALVASPEDDVAHFNLGKLLLERSQQEGTMTDAPVPAGNPAASRTISEALGHLKASIDASPECSHCHYFHAVALSQVGQMESAVSHYEQAIRIGPSDPYIHYNYAVTLDRMDRTADAVRQFTEAVRIKPDLGLAYFGMRDTLLRQEKAPETETLFRDIVTKTPSIPEARIALGDALMVQGKVEPAVKEFEEALRLQPGWDEAMMRLNAIQQQQGAPR